MSRILNCLTVAFYFGSIVIGLALADAKTVAANSDIANRIVGGELSTEGQFPYVVSLQQLSQIALTTRGHRCGGALITYQHAITAGSCVLEVTANGIQQITPSQYRIFAGSALLTADTVAERVRNISAINIHPEINVISNINDIAVITLTTPYLNTTVTPISLPSSNWAPNDFTLCTVVGWGGTNATSLASTQQRFATKYVYNRNLCTYLYNSIPGYPNILPIHTCAVSFDILTSGCINDEGNPLVCDGTFTGVLSFGDTCLASTYPELYTSVANYTTWIRTISGAHTYTPGLLLLTVLSILSLSAIM